MTQGDYYGMGIAIMHLKKWRLAKNVTTESGAVILAGHEVRIVSKFRRQLNLLIPQCPTCGCCVKLRVDPEYVEEVTAGDATGQTVQAAPTAEGVRVEPLSDRFD